MKRLSAILFAVLLVVGLGSCERECSNVLPEPTALTLNPSTVALKVGATRQLTATVEPTDQTYTVTFTSDNEKVATVNDKGLVTAVAEGIANITASVGNLTAKSVVTVSNAAPDVTLTVKTPMLTIENGKTAQIDYTVTPADTPVTFTSDKTDIATVDAQGVVTAVAAGSATITVAVAGQEAQVAVTVTDNGGGAVTEGNELPLLMFEAETDDNSVITQAVLDHEAKVGRTAQPFKIWKQGPFPGGFVNKDLTIVGAMYGLSLEKTGEYVIPAFSKESLADCPKTMAMLKEYGFTSFEEGVGDDNQPFKTSVCDNDPSISIELFDDPNAELGSTLMLLFVKPMPKQDLQVAHEILPDAKDFPSHTTLLTKDIVKIKEFEANLGFRDYSADTSDEAKKNLMFLTKKASLASTNLTLSVYICTPSSGPEFINCAVNCIRNANDFEDPKLKEWFTTNGYGNNYEASVAGGYAAGTDASGNIMAQIFISEDGSVALLQIVDMTKIPSPTQMRSLALKQYKKMLPLTKTKHRKLQQIRRH